MLTMGSFSGARIRPDRANSFYFHFVDMVYIRTVKSHRQTAPRVDALAEAIRNLASQIHGRYPIAHPLNRGIVNLQNTLSKMRSVLDDDFHSLMNDDEARREGNIYYGGRPCTGIEREDTVGADSDAEDLTEADSDAEEEVESDAEEEVKVEEKAKPLQKGWLDRLGI